MQYASTVEEVNQQVKDNDQLLIYKHSTQCPISADAHKEVERFLIQHQVPYAAVRVIEERPVSNAVQELTGVTHESPQAIIIKDEEVAWHASHREITAQALEDAWNSAKNS